MKQKITFRVVARPPKKWVHLAAFLLLLLPFGSSLRAQPVSGRIAMSRYLGGNKNETGFKIKQEGNFLYGIGVSLSTDFPVTLGSPVSVSGAFDGDIVVVKMDLQGNVIYSRAIGSSTFDLLSTTSNASFLVNNGEVYFAGVSEGTDYPTVGVPSSQTSGPGYRSFVITRLDASGNIVFSRYLGGSKGESVNNISLALENGFLYLGGSSSSADFPVTDGSTLNHGVSSSVDDIVITKMNASNGAIVYAKFLGTNVTDGTPTDIQVENGSVAFAFTDNEALGANTFPTTDGSLSHNGAIGTNDVIIVKLNPAGNVVYARSFGGAAQEVTAPNTSLKNGSFFVTMTAFSGNLPVTDGQVKKSIGLNQAAYAIKLDGAGNTVFARYLSSNGRVVPISAEYTANSYVIGSTVTSTGFDVTAGSGNSKGSTDFGITRIDATTGNTLFSTLVGGTGAETTTKVKYANNHYYLTGNTGSATYPVTDNTPYGGGVLEFVFTLLDDAGDVKFSRFLGGIGSEFSNSIANLEIDGNDIYLGGSSASNNYPITMGGGFGGGTTNDFVITKLNLCPSNYVTANDTVSPHTQTVCMQGLAKTLVGKKIVVPSDSLPNLYRNGVQGQQNEVEAPSYQWQVASNIAGPYNDITNATLENYLPVVSGVNQYYRRITRNSIFCGSNVISTSDTASVLVNALTAPIANAGMIKQTCAGSPVILGGAPTASGGAGGYTYTWDMGVAATANPSVSPLESTIYTLIVQDAAGCRKADQVVVNAYKADAGLDVSSCGGTAVQIGGAPLAGVAGTTYSWSPATGLSSASVAQPMATVASGTQVYTLTQTINKSGGGTCSTTDDVTVTGVGAPTAANFAGADGTICFGTSYNLGTPTEAGFTYTWAPGNYLSTNSASATVYNAGTLNFPPSPDPSTYYLTAKKSGCSFVDSVVVSVIRANAGGDFCGPRLLGDNTDAPNLNETFTWTKISGPGNFIGATNIAYPKVSASVGGTTIYQLVTSLNGTTCTDQVEVPECVCFFSINVTGPGCPSFNLGAVSLVAEGSDANYNYSWSPMVGLNTYTGSTVQLTDNVPRTYTVTRTSKIDPTFFCDQTILVNQPNMTLPIFSPIDTTVCPGTLVNIGEPNVAAYSYLWDGPAGLSSYTTANPTFTTPANNNTSKFSVLVTDIGSGCTVIDTARIRNLSTVADAGADFLTCSVGLVTLGTPALPGYTYSWSPVFTPQNGTSVTSAQPQLFVATNTTYTVTATNTLTGCTATDAVDVTVSPAPIIAAAPDVTVCKGLTVQIGSPAKAGVSYSWTPTTGLSNPNIAQPIVNSSSISGTQVYTLTVNYLNGACGIGSSDNVAVTVSDPAFTMSPISFCPSSGAVTLSGAPAGMTTYSWSPASQVSNPAIQTPTTLNPPPSTSFDYMLTVTNSLGCSATSTLTINPSISTPIAGSDRVLCLRSGPVTVGSASNQTGAGITYAWTGTNTALLSSTTSTTPIFTPTAVGTYRFRLTKTTTSPACSSFDSLIVVVTDYNLPTLPNKTVCGGSCVSIGEASPTAASYVWTPSTSLSNSLIANPTACPTVSTIYTVVATGANGCRDTASASVTVSTGTPPTITMNDVTVCYGSASTIQFNPTVTPASTYTYAWTPNDVSVSNVNVLNPIINILGLGNKLYTLTVTDPVSGCAASKTDSLIVKNCYVSLAGNVFHDANGLTDSKVNGTGFNANTTLYVHLLDVNGVQIGVTPVNADGSYNFPTVLPATYSLVLNTNGSSSTTPSLTGAGTGTEEWVNTGENHDLPTVNGNDGAINGVNVGIVVSTTNVINVNFGIQERPKPEDKTLPIQNNPGGTVNITITNDFISSDPDGTVSSLTLTSFPSNVTSIKVGTTTYYVNAGAIPGTCPTATCAVFPTAGITVPTTTAGVPTSAITIDPIDGAVTPVIPFYVTDNAGFRSSGTGKVVVPLKVPPASLGNRVWLDNNNDGLQTAGEPGVAGVAVSLYKGTTLVGSTTTDAYGMYLFTDLVPGTDYSVKVTPPANYSFTTQGTAGASGAGSATDCDVNAGGTSPQITVVAGMSQLDVDAGLVFTSTSVSSIGDRVWFDTNSNGDQDATEAGVAGVTVTLLKETTTGSGVYVPYLSTTTDGDGMYLFNNLPNNTNYKVAVTPLPNTKLTSSTGTTPGNTTTNSDVDATTGLSAAINIPAAGAAIRGIDAGLIEDVKSSLGDRVWNDVNNNGIQDAGEQGVPNVTMTLLKETAPGSGTYTAAGTTTTDANGLYLFSGLDAANYKVTATLPSGYSVSPMNAAGGTEYNNSDFSVTGTPTSGVYALAANQDYAGVDMGIHNNTAGLGSLGDRVWSDVNNNGIQDAGEPGVAGISVRLLDGSNNPVNNPATGQPYVLVTDAAGAYKFVDLPAGTYRVAFGNLPANTQFSPTGAGTTATDSDPNPATGITSNIVLAAGQNRTDVDAGIAPFAPVGLASLGDRVWIDANNNGIQDAGEQGASGVTVTLYAADGTTVIKTTTTNAAGNYLFDGLNAGSYVVGFSGFPTGYALQTGKNDLGGNDMMDSDPNPTTGKTVVVNLATGEKNSSVDAGIYNTSATNSIGDYVWLDANNDGLQTSGEKAMPGITVSLLDNTGKVISSVVTDANGAYKFGNLPNGDYTVRISPPAGLSFTTPNVGGGLATDNSKFGVSGVSPVVTLSGGTNVTNIDAGLVTTKALLGDRVWNDVNGNGIQDAGEPGIAGVTVTLYAANGTTVVSSAITDANGNYLFTNLDPASYVVGFTTIPAGMVFTTQDASGSTAANGSDVIVGTGKTAPVALAAGEVNLNVDAGLTPVILGAISGVVWNDGVAGDNVRSATEPLIPGVTVTLKDNLGNVVGTTRTDGKGAYLFDRLPAGTGYTVTFSGYPATATLVNQTTGTANGSDANQTTGVTPSITVVGGATTPNIDAGVTVYIPLPLRGLAFNAIVKDCQVQLTWLNKEEVNTKQYELLSSDNGAAFKVVGTIKVNKSTNGSYQYVDQRSVNGNRIYRLRLTDLDGTISNSDVVKVTGECSGTTKIVVYPNPATNTLSVDLSEVSGAVTYELINTIGSHILRGSLNGGSINKINLGDVASGSYLINISVDGVTKGYKVHVVK